MPDQQRRGTGRTYLSLFLPKLVFSIYLPTYLFNSSFDIELLSRAHRHNTYLPSFDRSFRDPIRETNQSVIKEIF